MTYDQLEDAIANGLSKAGKKFGYYVAGWIIFTLLLTAAIAASSYGRDSTDGEDRSNMQLHTDALTGCQYLSTSSGGMYPRMRHDRHVGCY